MVHTDRAWSTRTEYGTHGKARTLATVATPAHHEVQHQVNYVRQMGTKNGR
jgi:hypothetical protein